MLSAGENNCDFKQAATVGNLGRIATVKEALYNNGLASTPSSRGKW